MSTASHDSNTPYGLEPIPSGADPPSEGLVIGQAGIWLDGDVLSCLCPDCGTPMSIRLWLMVADCFRCGASIELSEEQEQEALRLLREQEKARRTASAEAAAAIAPTIARKTRMRPQPQPTGLQPAEPRPEPPRPKREAPSQRPAAEPEAAPEPAAQPAYTGEARPRRRRAADVHRGARAKVREIYEKGGLAVWWSELFKDMPAWLVSLVVHLVAMLLLGLWMDEPPREDLELTLATSVSYEDLEGDQGEIEESQPEAFEFEDPGAIEIDNVVEDTGTAPEDAVDLEPVEPVVDIPDPVGHLPDLAMRENTAINTAPIGRMLQGRDPTVRAQMIEREGGTTFTEAAVARALKWLARYQNADGSWSLHAFNKAPGAEDKLSGEGRTHSDMAGTSLALLPFLGAAQSHMSGDYTTEVTAGLRWIVEHQKEDGDCRGSGERNAQMYAHAQATIVLCEAYELSRDEQLREPAQLALNFIVKAQHGQGGWRYSPGQAGDTSVVGWQLMALKTGQTSYLYVPSKTFELAGVFVDGVKCDKIGGRYAYQRGGRPTEAMTAEALLCRQYLGWPKDHPGLKDGAKWLLENHLPDRKKPNVYYWYYGTQMMHHLGGSRWEKWNERMRQVLVDMQEKNGPAAGSWAPCGPFGDRGGRIYMTSLAACILEVYYRHMSLYRKEMLEGF